MENAIVNKIRKLLNLANAESASEGERDNALRMAHGLLAKHNLDMSQVELQDGAAGEARENSIFSVRPKIWMTQVSNSVAKLFFCNVFMTKRQGSIDLTFVGRASNVATAKAIAAYVVESIRKEGQRRAKGDSAWHLSFNKGASQRIHERCTELRNSAETASQGASTGTSLVLASVYKTEIEANADYIRRVMGVNLRSASKGRSSSVRGDAFHAGREYGSTVSLSRQVGGNSGQLRIGR